MFNGPILDVAFGLMFAFLTVSLAAGTLVEAASSMTKWRSRTLLSGIKSLVNDPQATGLALELYKHASISPRDSGTATTIAGLKNKPAYIDPRQFATAFLDIVKLSAVSPGPASVNAMLAALNAKIPATPPQGGAPPQVVPDAQLNTLFTGIINRAQGDFGKMQTELADWFDNGMDRLSGEYKRLTQMLTFLLALAMAGVCNFDSIGIGRALWVQPSLVKSLKPEAASTPDRAIADLTAYLPVGWTAEATAKWPDASRTAPLTWVPRTSNQWLMVAGWLITALASLFGAPFWFDTLQKVARLKGSGPSPDEKRDGASAAA